MVQENDIQHIDNIAGSPVEGKNFFGRADIVQQLFDLLQHHDILLLGPRRIGKTSAARAVMGTARLKQWGAIEINVASCMDERDFLRKLEKDLMPALASFTDKSANWLSDICGGVFKRIGSVKITGVVETSFKHEPSAEDWTVVANDILQLLAQAEKNWLIYIDELPIMLFNIIRNDAQHGVMRVRRFLDWFRNDVRMLPKAKNIRWLLSGSVGLDTLVQEHGMADTINSLNHQGLPAYSDEQAQRLLLALASSYQMQLSAAHALQLVHAVQWPQPYYLQVAFQHLRTLIITQPTREISELIELAINSMIQPDADNDFHHWEKRLTMQLKPSDTQHALTLLNASSATQQGSRPESLLEQIQQRMPDANEDQTRQVFIRLRDILLRDGYWQEQTTDVKRYCFRLEPLRRWWQRRNTL